MTPLPNVVVVVYDSDPHRNPHASCAVDPLGEFMPAGQSEQASVPMPILYVPGKHAVHAAPDHVNPAEHRQSIKEGLPASELVPTGHGTQAEEPMTSL